MSDATYLQSLANDKKAARRILRAAAAEHGYTIGPVYHGSDSAPFNCFEQKRVGSATQVDTVGFWFGANRNAVGFYHSGFSNDRKRVMAVLLRGRFMDVSTEEFISQTHGPCVWAARAKDLGFDGVIVRQIIDGDTRGDVFCAFDARNIKLSNLVVRDDTGEIVLPSRRFDPDVADLRGNVLGNVPCLSGRAVRPVLVADVARSL